LDSINKMAQYYNYDVVAEHVGSEEIYQVIRELDIGYSQGFYLGKPKPIEEYIGE